MTEPWTVFRFRCPACMTPGTGVVITAQAVLSLQEGVKIIQDKHPSCPVENIEVVDIHGNTFGTKEDNI